jgi:hypothetical protein
LPVLLDNRLLAPHAHNHPGICAQERIACDALSTLNRFEQERRAKGSGAMRRKAPTGVCKSASTVRTTGTTLPRSASRSNSSKDAGRQIKHAKTPGTNAVWKMSDKLQFVAEASTS